MERRMENLKASDVMVRPVVSVKENASARDVALKLGSGHHSGMPVTNEKGELIGIITELDILNALYEGKELVKITAKDIMRENVMTARLETGVKDIIETMSEWNFIRLPVVDEEGKLVGIVARSDILNAHIHPEFVMHL